MFNSVIVTKFKLRDSLAIVFKIILPVFLTIILFIITVYLIAIPKIEDDYLDSKKEMVQELTKTVWHLLSDYESRVLSGELTRAEAKKRAIRRIRNLRYGSMNKDYFWINDMHPNMVMHPYRTDLEGTDITEFVDPTGKHLFVEFVKVVRKHDSGFVMYMWQLHDRTDIIVPKISFVMGFAPWGWIIGTGIYIEDIKERIAVITNKLNRAFLAIFVLIFIISLFIIIQGIIGEKRRRKAEWALVESEQLLRKIIEFLPDATLVIDKDEQIIAWNKAMEEMTGISSHEMIGRGNYEYAVPFYGKRRPLLINLIINPDPQLEKNYVDVKREGEHLVGEAFTPGIGKDGRYLYARAALLYDRDGNVSGAIETIRDITESKRAEENLLVSVKEKEILLKEIHHRVKNNLQVISSLLNLQADYIENPHDLNVFKNSQAQILSMAAIHEKLYQSGNFSNINMKDFLQDLLYQLQCFYNDRNSEIDIGIDVDNVVVSIEYAIPLSMLINEIVTNSLKYAYPGGSGGIHISFSKVEETKFSLIIYDNGIGFTDDAALHDKRTFGLTLIDTLVRQLNGEMTRRTDNGTRYEIVLHLKLS
ncbi:MAG TPA: cache domain-containing protein [Spirochaetota bacterium]|nr:cache domain-containing protein [Spirochaetota bacterium]